MTAEVREINMNDDIEPVLKKCGPIELAQDQEKMDKVLCELCNWFNAHGIDASC